MLSERIRFASPQGMAISWMGPGGNFPDTGLTAPGRYNFPQGATYRLKLSGLVKYPTASFYPTLGEGRFTGTQQATERLALAIVQELQADW